MKDRARGNRGRRGGVASTLDQIQNAFPGIRIHLHRAAQIYGCRVIASSGRRYRKTSRRNDAVPGGSFLLARFPSSPDYDSTHQPGDWFPQHRRRTEMRGSDVLRSPTLFADEAAGLYLSHRFPNLSARIRVRWVTPTMFTAFPRPQRRAPHAGSLPDGDLLRRKAPTIPFAPGRIFQSAIRPHHSGLRMTISAEAGNHWRGRLIAATAGLGRILGLP